MNVVAKYHVPAVVGGLAVGASTLLFVTEPVLAGLTAALWVLSLSAVTFGYRHFDEWADSESTSGRGWILRTAGVALAVGGGTYLVAVSVLSVAPGSAAWMAVSMATAAPLTAGVVAALSLQEARQAGDAEESEVATV